MCGNIKMTDASLDPPVSVYQQLKAQLGTDVNGNGEQVYYERQDTYHERVVGE